MKYLIVCLLSSVAAADTVKVIKVQGQRAIVQAPPGVSMQVGQMLTTEDGDITLDAAPSKVSHGKRSQVIGGLAEISSTTSAASGGSTVTRSVISVEGRYGWNKGVMEYGPFAALNKTSTGTADITSWSAGGFFDYNLIPNVVGREMVYGVGGEAWMGGLTTANQNANIMGVFAGGFVKWFPLGNSVAVRGDAGLRYVRSSTAVTTTDTGFVAKGGFEIYF